jgi:cytochrome c oxidase cbb3-type subunit 3
MSSGWSWYVVLITVVNIVASAWLLLWARSKRVDEPQAGETLGHDFDGIEEYDTPLPRWWLWLFIGTIAFSAAYLVLYPGLGSFAGTLGWSQHGQYDAEMQRAAGQYGPLYAAYAAKSIEELSRDNKAVRTGQRLYANTCAGCHGADARGGVGYPDLTDNDWIFGGTPAAIKTSILDGRMGVMPPFAPALGGDEGVANVVAYTLSLSGRKVDPARAAAGKEKFLTICAACHGPEGKGNPAVGAPNLTDDIWLFGGTPQAIEEGLRKGRMSRMPPHRDILGEERAHLIAAYIYGLSHEGEGAMR